MKKIDTAGMYRCCIQTIIRETNKQSELTKLKCNYCQGDLEKIKGVWKWIVKNVRVVNLDNIDAGGMYRCCIQTIIIETNKQSELTKLKCKYCQVDLEKIKGVWKWIVNLDNIEEY